MAKAEAAISSSSPQRRMGRGTLVGAGSPEPRRRAGRRPAVLAIHGFGGTPVEVDLVVEAATRLGLEAYAPLLPGHGTHADDLAATRWEDWREAAVEALHEVSTPAQPVIVCGLSLGSVLACDLALSYPGRVRALGLLANALWLPKLFPGGALELVRRLRIPDFQLPKVAADLGDPVNRKNHLTYSAQPVHAAVSVQQAGKRVRRRLDEIRCPTLIVHGKRDRVCSVDNAARAARALGSRDKRVLILPRSRHILTRDVERAEVAEVISEFLSDHSPI